MCALKMGNFFTALHLTWFVFVIFRAQRGWIHCRVVTRWPNVKRRKVDDLLMVHTASVSSQRTVEPVFYRRLRQMSSLLGSGGQEAESPAEGCFLIHHQQARMRSALS